MKFSLPVVAAGIIVGFAGVGTCAASTVASATYQTVAGANDGNSNEIVNATLTLVLNDNAGVYTLGLTVTNNDKTSDIRSDGQEITGFKFSLPGVSGTAAASGTGELVSFGSGGSVTPTGATNLTQWTSSTSLASVAMSIFTGGQPNMGILPSSNAGTGTCTPASDYCNADSSVVSNHDPPVDGAATFTLSGGTGMSTLTQAELDALTVQINFGTIGATGDLISANYVSTVTPEPGSIALCLGGLGLLLVGSRRRRP